MPRVCTVCNHPERDKIEAAIVASTPLRNIAQQFSIGYVSIQRHAVNHLAQAIKEVKQEQVIQSGSSALERMASGEKIVDEIIKYAWCDDPKLEKMPELALKALAEMRRMIELRAKLEGELDERSITITAIPEWAELRSLLLEALSPYPQAKMAVIRAMEEHDVQSA